MQKLSFALGILILPSAFHSVQAQTVETRIKTGSISGRVMVKGEPAKNILVYLRQVGSWTLSNPDDYLRARTDEGGRFRIAGLAAGSYYVIPLAPGFVYSADEGIGPSGKTVKVSEGENIENVDIEIYRGGVITGRVTDSQGKPLVRMQVLLSRLEKDRQSFPNSGYGPSLEMYMTDDRGVYRIFGLPVGRYLVSVGFRPAAGPVSVSGDGTFYPQTFHPRAANESEAKVIEVTEGSESAGVDITLLTASSQGNPSFNGVITGRVTTLTGEPMVCVQVTAVLVKGLDGYPEPRELRTSTRPTDDRGVYRLYGLRPGIYVVFTQGKTLSSPISPYEGYAPTYHPSSPRETAAEVMVTKGREASGVDIRYRGERGHTVSGVAPVAEAAPRGSSMTVALFNASSSFLAGSQNFGRVEAQNHFTIKGVTDGEYEIFAHFHGTGNDESLVSPPRRVTVSGGDVGGIELKLAPQASISGKVVVEASSDACEDMRKSSPSRVIVFTRPDTKSMLDARQFALSRPGVSVSKEGEFKIFNLDPNRYFISLLLPDENWYAKSIVAPVATARRDSVEPVAAYDVGRNGLALKWGDRMTGLIVTIADGAASLRGSLEAGNESLRAPARMVIHLVPAEAAAADDVLR